MSPEDITTPLSFPLARHESARPFLPSPEFTPVPGYAATRGSDHLLKTPLHDHAVALRPFRAADLPQLHEATLETARSLCAWMTWCHPGYSRKDCESFLARTAADWEADTSYSLAIVDTGDQVLYGSIGLNHISRTHGFANVGYWVRNSQACRGIASRALRLIAQFGFQELRLSRIEIVIPEANIASQRVAQKAGAKFEGLLRRKLVLNGKSHDAVIYSVLETDLSRASHTLDFAGPLRERPAGLPRQ